MNQTTRGIATDYLENEYGKLLEQTWNLDETYENADTFNGWTMMEIKSNDPRGNQPDCIEAKCNEVQGLQKRQIWSVAKGHDISASANVIGGRFILTLKNYQTPNEQPKVRYVAQGYRDRYKPLQVHDASTLCVSSIEMLLSNESGVKL